MSLWSSSNGSARNSTKWPFECPTVSTWSSSSAASENLLGYLRVGIGPFLHVCYEEVLIAQWFHLFLINVFFSVPGVCHKSLHQVQELTSFMFLVIVSGLKWLQLA